MTELILAFLIELTVPLLLTPRIKNDALYIKWMVSNVLTPVKQYELSYAYNGEVFTEFGDKIQSFYLMNNLEFSAHFPCT